MKKLFFLMVVMTIVFSSCQNGERYRLLFDSETCQGTMILSVKGSVTYQTLVDLQKEINQIILKGQTSEEITTAVYQSLRKFIGTDYVDFALMFKRENVEIKIHGLSQATRSGGYFFYGALITIVIGAIAFLIVALRKIFKETHS